MRLAFLAIFAILQAISVLLLESRFLKCRNSASLLLVCAVVAEMVLRECVGFTFLIGKFCFGAKLARDKGRRLLLRRPTRTTRRTILIDSAID